MLQVNIVLQQLPHHLDVTLLGCRDQRRPAVLRTETTRYSGNCHRTQKTSSRRRKKGRVSFGRDAQDLPGQRKNLPIGRTRCSWERDVASAYKSRRRAAMQEAVAASNAQLLPLSASATCLGAPCVIAGYSGREMIMRGVAAQGCTHVRKTGRAKRPGDDVHWRWGPAPGRPRVSAKPADHRHLVRSAAVREVRHTR